MKQILVLLGILTLLIIAGCGQPFKESLCAIHVPYENRGGEASFFEVTPRSCELLKERCDTLVGCESVIWDDGSYFCECNQEGGK